MDIVITYVDGTDPSWIKEFQDHLDEIPIAKRYRDWGTLKYLLRGIDRHMTFIRKVFLVVSSATQVPSWIDTSTVKIVLHKDIIPSQYLPTFNSSMIEMFLHRIPGLSERFIYFNDDMFPVMDCQEEDFFICGLPAMGMCRHIISGSAYLRLARRSDILAKKASGTSNRCFFLRPQHICSPMLKSACEELYKNVWSEISLSLTPLRSESNYNQYLFLDYMFYKGKLIDRPITRKHYSMAIASIGKIREFLRSPDRKIVCINDVKMNDSQFERASLLLQKAFWERYPLKSVYEIAEND